MVDGVYQDIVEALKPGVRENEIVALANKRLYEMGSDRVEAINAISGERCNPHPHNFTDRLIRPGDQAFFDIIQSFMGYRTCYYRTFAVGQRDAGRSATPTRRRASGWTRRSAGSSPAVDRRDRARCPKAEEIGFASEMAAFGLQLLPRPRPRAARAAAHLAAHLAEGAGGAQGRHGVRRRDLLPGERRLIGGADRGGGDPRRRRARRSSRSIPPRNCRLPTPTKMANQRSAGSAPGAWATRWPSAWRRRLRPHGLEPHARRKPSRWPSTAPRCATSSRSSPPGRRVRHGLHLRRREGSAGPEGTVRRLRGAKPRMVVEVLFDLARGLGGTARRRLARKESSTWPRPVSGNAKVIKAGKLTFVVSGPGGVRCGAALPRDDRRRLGYVGEGELARIAKICHNVMLGVVIQNLCARSPSWRRRPACRATPSSSSSTRA